jgi:hypothetical protein
MVVAAVVFSGCGVRSSQSATTGSGETLGRPIAMVGSRAPATSSDPTNQRSPEMRTTLKSAPGVESQCHYQTYPDGTVVPDPSCTPGALNPAAVANPSQTICLRGYSERIRPPASYTEPLKITDMVQYASVGPPSSYEEDHLVAIEDGGNARDVKNLWPEYLYGPGGALQKDKVENQLHELICAGKLTVVEAARVLEGDWKHAFSRR